MIKPWRILLFLFSVFIILFSILIVFPNGNINISNSFSIRLPDIHKTLNTFNNLISKKTQEISDSNKLTELQPVLIINDSLKIQNKDSLKLIDTSSYKTGISGNKNGNKLHFDKSGIQFPNDIKSILYPFFLALSLVNDSSDIIRILHYGDSQIEGDRVTSYIRNQFQRRFGGRGIGLFPVVMVSEYYRSVKHEISKNWKKFSITDIIDGSLSQRKIGALYSFSRFTPLEYDPTADPKFYESYINISKSYLSYNLVRKFSKCRIFYGFNRRPLVVEVYQNDKLFDAEILLAQDKLMLNEWDFDTAGTNISIRFRGEDSPDIYGIALDGDHGVAVDNIPLRGSKGLDFTKADMQFLKEMDTKLNVKLIILEFGVNIVMHKLNNYRYYENEIYKQLIALKELNPEIPIILMGVSDMAIKENGELKSYSNIPDVRDAQRKAAFNANCAFWDTYEAMGGKNSMIRWVEQNPPLAQKDYTHFSYEGSKKIAELFYQSLIKEYDEYLRIKKSTSNE